MKPLAAILRASWFPLLVIALIVLCGAPRRQPKPAVARPAVVIESLIPLPPEVELMWQAEIGRRFDNAVGVIVHGGDFVEGQWIVGSSLQPWKHVSSAGEIVEHFQTLYPGRTVVLISCNPGHLKLGIPGVFYARSSVWVIPDRDVMDLGVFALQRWDTFDGPRPCSFGTRWSEAPDVVGNIFEFVSD